MTKTAGHVVVNHANGLHEGITNGWAAEFESSLLQGFAHGFVVISDTAIFTYKVDNYYSAENDRGLAFNDMHLNINWLLPKEHLRLSEKDQKQPNLSGLKRCFEYGAAYYG